MPKPITDPLFLHVHIHKCAGTAFNDLIRRSFAPRHLDAYIADPFPSHRPEDLEAMVNRWPAVQSISSHSIRIFPKTIAGRTPLYVCFLREPVDWFVSYLTYARKHFAELSDSHRARLPANAPDMPLAEMAERVTDELIARPTVYGTFVRDLAESSFRHALEDLIDLPPFDQPLTGEAETLFVERGLEIAKRNLQRFFFVGIVEQMEQSVALLRNKLAGVGMTLADGGVGQLNVTRQHRDDLLWLNESHPLGRKIRHWLRDDLLLYQWAKRSTGGPPVSS